MKQAGEEVDQAKDFLKALTQTLEITQALRDATQKGELEQLEHAIERAEAENFRASMSMTPPVSSYICLEHDPPSLISLLRLIQTRLLGCLRLGYRDFMIIYAKGTLEHVSVFPADNQEIEGSDHYSRVLTVIRGF